MATVFERFDNWFWGELDMRRLSSSRWATCTNSYSWSVVLFSYRFIAFAFLFGFEVWEWCCKEYGPGLYITYLTYQGMWFTIIYFFFACINHFIVFCTAKWPTAKWNSFQVWCAKHVRRATQTMFDISVPIELLIVVLYWSMIFDGSWASEELKIRDIIQHVVTFVILWVDLALGASRLPDRHVIIPLSTALVYVCWNAAFTVNNYPVYSMLKWVDYWSAIIVVAALVGVVIFHFLASLLAFLLDRLSMCKMRSSARSSAEEAYPATFTDSFAAYPCHTCCCCPAQDPKAGLVGTAKVVLVHDNELLNSGVNPTYNSVTNTAPPVTP